MQTSWNWQLEAPSHSTDIENVNLDFESCLLKFCTLVIMQRFVAWVAGVWELSHHCKMASKRITGQIIITSLWEVLFQRKLIQRGSHQCGWQALISLMPFLQLRDQACVEAAKSWGFRAAVGMIYKLLKYKVYHEGELFDYLTASIGILMGDTLSNPKFWIIFFGDFEIPISDGDILWLNYQLPIKNKLMMSSHWHCLQQDYSIKWIFSIATVETTSS